MLRNSDLFILNDFPSSVKVCYEKYSKSYSLYRLNAKCNKKLTQNVVNFFNMVQYMLVVWSETVGYDLEMFHTI